MKLCDVSAHFLSFLIDEKLKTPGFFLAIWIFHIVTRKPHMTLPFIAIQAWDTQTFDGWKFQMDHGVCYTGQKLSVNLFGTCSSRLEALPGATMAQQLYECTSLFWAI